MANRAEKLRRRQRRKEKKVQRGPGSTSYVAPTGDLVVVNPRGQAKMSDVLTELVRPDWNTCANEEDMRKLLTLGLVAWNAALFQGAKRAAYLDDFAKTFPAESRSDFYFVIEPLIRRKEELFPQNKRPMLSYDLTWLPSGEPYLTVVSGLA